MQQTHEDSCPNFFSVSIVIFYSMPPSSSLLHMLTDSRDALSYKNCSAFLLGFRPHRACPTLRKEAKTRPQSTFPHYLTTAGCLLLLLLLLLLALSVLSSNK